MEAAVTAGATTTDEWGMSHKVQHSEQHLVKTESVCSGSTIFLGTYKRIDPIQSIPKSVRYWVMNSCVIFF